MVTLRIHTKMTSPTGISEIGGALQAQHLADQAIIDADLWGCVQLHWIVTALTIKVQWHTRFSHFLEARAQLGEIGMMDLICITSPEMIIKHLLGLDQVVTLEKFARRPQ